DEEFGGGRRPVAGLVVQADSYRAGADDVKGVGVIRFSEAGRRDLDAVDVDGGLIAVHCLLYEGNGVAYVRRGPGSPDLVGEHESARVDFDEAWRCDQVAVDSVADVEGKNVS